MARVAATLAGLGTGSSDGAEGIVRIGTNEVRLRWKEAEGWVGRPLPAMKQLSTIGMSSAGAEGDPVYPVQAESPLVHLGPVEYGFQIHKIVGAGDFWAAGLRLQERLRGTLQSLGGTPVGPPQLKLAHYVLSEGDSFLSPAPYNLGPPLIGELDDPVFRYYESGWKDVDLADTEPVAGQTIYPELYRYNSNLNFRHLTIEYRWVGTGVSEQATPAFVTRPPMASVCSWHVADALGGAHNTAVPYWPDRSGRGRDLVAPTSGRRPTLQRTGGPNGHAFVRFDGVDDALRSTVLLVSQPWSIFMVLRQNSGGGTQEVWAAGGGSGAPLIYKNDAVDQVNVWTGGSDILYHRSSTWPSPWMVISVIANGASSEVYENSTLKVSGNPGSGGITGLTIGGSGADALPAKIDVAEVVVAYKAPTSGERAAVIGALRTKYGI